MKRTLLLFGAFAGLGFACSPSEVLTEAEQEGAQSMELAQKSTEQLATGRAGMVVSAHSLASKAGAKILQMGGSAVDAAIAVQLALNVVEPQNSGIGGGGFLMFYEARTRKTFVIDCRERAPATARPDMFLLPSPPSPPNTPIPFATRQTLGSAVGVPGTLKCITVAHQRWGQLPFKHLIQPAIQLAEEGVPVGSVLASDIAIQKSKLLLNPAAASLFVPGGIGLVQGHLLVQPDLARTFRILQREGITPFYDGRIADAMVADVAARGGSLTRADLRSYQPTLDLPVVSGWRGLQIAATAPPSSGGVTVLQILTLLDVLGVDAFPLRSSAKYHLLAEASHLAYADRAKYIGDPEFVNVPVQGLLHPDYLASRAALVSPSHVDSPPVLAGDPLAFDATPWPPGQAVSAPGTSGLIAPAPDERSHTTHFAVADCEHNLITWTSTIEQPFGTGIVVAGYGFLLNNEVTDFNATPSGPNQAGPGKRPMSSMTPTLVFADGKPILALGSSGGPRIILAVAQTILNRITYQLDLKPAIEEPRIYSPTAPALQWAQGVPAPALAELQALGYVPAGPTARGFLGVVQAIAIHPVTGIYTGAADSGRDGSAIGINR